MDDAGLHRVDKQQARRSFGNAVDSYDEAAALQREVGQRLVERLDLVRLTPGRILDLGCGTGDITDALMSRYRKADVVSLDLAFPMVQQSRRRGGWFRKPRGVCADAEALPFQADSFDLVVSNLMLQWCQDLDRVFADLLRVLRPGGLLLFTTFGPDTLRELRDSWERVDSGHTHVNAFIDMHDIGDALIRTRFAEPVMDVEHMIITYQNVNRLMRDLKALGAHNVTAGRHKGLTGKNKMAGMMSAYETFRVDGLLPASYEVVHGHAWAPENKAALSLPAGEAHISIDQLRRS